MEDGDTSNKPPPGTQWEPKLPPIRDLSSFTKVMECFEDDGNGDFKFKCTMFLLVDQDEHTAWLGSIDIPRKHVSVEQATSCLRHVPENEIYPPVTPEIQGHAVDASSGGYNYALAGDTWLKRPMIAVHNQTAGTTRIADELLEEIAVYQLLLKNPHPNLAEFRGCLLKDGRIVGILLKRYALTLSTRVEVHAQPRFDAALFLQHIHAGVAHLHGLGLAHNDLNPENIMMDEQDRPVIIDMGSAKRFGEHMSQGGTPDWNDGFGEVSSRGNDEIGLEKIREWLEAFERRRR